MKIIDYFDLTREYEALAKLLSQFWDYPKVLQLAGWEVKEETTVKAVIQLVENYHDKLIESGMDKDEAVELAEDFAERHFSNEWYHSYIWDECKCNPYYENDSGGKDDK